MFPNGKTRRRGGGIKLVEATGVQSGHCHATISRAGEGSFRVDRPSHLNKQAKRREHCGGAALLVLDFEFC